MNKLVQKPALKDVGSSFNTTALNRPTRMEPTPLEGRRHKISWIPQYLKRMSGLGNAEVVMGCEWLSHISLKHTKNFIALVYQGSLVVTSSRL